MARTFFTAFLVVFFAAGCSNDLKGDEVGPKRDHDTDVEDTGLDDTGEPEIDADGDGFKPSEGDCDDEDDSVYPAAPELCDDKDNDCDGISDADLDDDEDGLKDCSDFCPIMVDETATSGLQNGSFTDPFVWIQDAIDAAAALSCDTIRVRPGTYLESIDYLGQDLDVASTAGPDLTEIVGDGSGSVVTFATGESELAILEGFTITDGGGEKGGGVHAYLADPTILGNVITGNAADEGGRSGGGVYLYDSWAMLLGNEITYNDAGYGLTEEGNDGGAIFVRGGAPVIEANVLAHNSAGDGGALWLAYSDALVVNNWIAANAAHDDDPEQGGQGGGVNVQIGTDDFYMAGNVVVDNVASTHGGGVAIYEYHASYGDPWVVNNTIAFNAVTDTSYGAGLVGWSLTRSYVVNNAIYANDGTGVWLNSTTTFRYNDVYGNTTNYGGDQGTLTGVGGNVSVDPRFKGVSDDGDWTNDDWRPTSASKLRDAGDADIFDTDGSRSDIGATGGPYGM